MKKYIIIGAIMLAMCIAISILWNMYSKEKKERQRQESNVSVLNDSVKHSTIRDSLNVASISALNYTVDELKKYRAADLRLIKDLKIKNKNLESLTKVNTTIIDTIYKDRWHISPTNPDCLEYKDRWATIEACFKDSIVSYAVRDSLDIVVDRIPKHRFLWWQWGTKGYKVNVVNFNPHSKIGYLEYIRVEK